MKIKFLIRRLFRRTSISTHYIFYNSKGKLLECILNLLRYWQPKWDGISDPLNDRITSTEKESKKILVMMHSGKLINLYVKCFKTARYNSTESSIELFTDFTEREKMILNPFDINFHEIKTKDFTKKKTALKVEPLRHLNFKFGDKIIISDLDVLYQSDPFRIFDKDFDVFITTRHYDYHYLINSGIWGFRVNERSRRFIEFYIKQLQTRSWRPLREFRQRFCRDPFGFDILLDQDFLCAIYENLHNLPKEIKDVRFYDAGYKYNFCPSYDILGIAAADELKSKIGNREYVVLHFKGELKQVLDMEVSLF